MIKRVALLSISVMCLAITALISFHLGNQSAQAQAPGVIQDYWLVGGSGGQGTHFVMMTNGDVYFNASDTSGRFDNNAARFVGNFFTGNGTVPTSESTWGQQKSRYQDDN